MQDSIKISKNVLMGDRVECPVPLSTILSTMMKQKGFHDSDAGDKFF